MFVKKICQLAAGAFYAIMAAFLSGCFATFIMLQDSIRKMMR